MLKVIRLAYPFDKHKWINPAYKTRDKRAVMLLIDFNKYK
jgi:hypothetical protein